MKSLHFGKRVAFLSILFFSSILVVFSAKTVPYCIGADISWVQQQEDKGLTYTDNGVKKEVLTILTDNGFNWIRLRLFVDPKAEKGYSKEGYCDLEHTLSMAKRIKATSPRWGNLFDKDGVTTEYMKLYPALAEKFKARPKK